MSAQVQDPDTTRAQRDALERLAWRHDQLQVDYAGRGVLKVALRDRRHGQLMTVDVVTIDPQGGARYVGW